MVVHFSGKEHMPISINPGSKSSSYLTFRVELLMLCERTSGVFAAGKLLLWCLPH